MNNSRANYQNRPNNVARGGGGGGMNNNNNNFGQQRGGMNKRPFNNKSQYASQIRREPNLYPVNSGNNHQNTAAISQNAPAFSNSLNPRNQSQQQQQFGQNNSSNFRGSNTQQNFNDNSFNQRGGNDSSNYGGQIQQQQRSNDFWVQGQAKNRNFDNNKQVDQQQTGKNGNNFGGNQGYLSNDFYTRPPPPPPPTNNFGNNDNFGNDFVGKHFNRDGAGNGNSASMNWPAAFPTASANDQDVQAGPGTKKREKRTAPWTKTDTLLTPKPLTRGRGMNLLQRMGWRPGEGLGKNNKGSLQPLLMHVKLNKRGLISQDEKTAPPPKKKVKTPTLVVEGKHPISILCEYAMQQKFHMPQYIIKSEGGHPHLKTFIFSIKLNGVDYVMPDNTEHHVKKKAKEIITKYCLEQLGINIAKE